MLRASVALAIAGLSCTWGAVIEVTASGDQHNVPQRPTFQFSDLQGSRLANLSADSEGTVQASGDLVAGNGVSVENLASQLAAALEVIELQQAQIQLLNATVTAQQQQSSIASLQAQVLSFQTFLEHKIIRLTNAGNSKFNGHYFMFGFQDTDCRWEDNREAARLCTCIDCAGCGTDPPWLFKQGGSESSPGSMFWNLMGCGQAGRYQATSCGSQNPAECSTWTNKDGMASPAPTFQQLTSFGNAATAATNVVIG